MNVIYVMTLYVNLDYFQDTGLIRFSNNLVFVLFALKISRFLGPLTEATDSASKPVDGMILEDKFVFTSEPVQTICDYTFQQQTPLSLDNIDADITKELETPQDDPDVTV